MVSKIGASLKSLEPYKVEIKTMSVFHTQVSNETICYPSVQNQDGHNLY